MFNYHSELAQRPNGYQQTVSDMRGVQSPYAGQNHQDNFAGLHQARAMDMSRYAQQAQAEEDAFSRGAQRDLALAGLQMLGNDQQNAQNLQNSRTQMLLGGLL
jgi:hypothetical protein